MDEYISIDNILYKYNAESKMYSIYSYTKYNGNIININDQIYVKIGDDYKTIHKSDYIENIVYYKDDDYTIIVYQSELIYVTDGKKTCCFKMNDGFNCPTFYLNTYNENRTLENIQKCQNNVYFASDILECGIYIFIEHKSCGTISVNLKYGDLYCPGCTKRSNNNKIVCGILEKQIKISPTILCYNDLISYRLCIYDDNEHVSKKAIHLIKTMFEKPIQKKSQGVDIIGESELSKNEHYTRFANYVKQHDGKLKMVFKYDDNYVCFFNNKIIVVILIKRCWCHGIRCANSEHMFYNSLIEINVKYKYENIISAYYSNCYIVIMCIDGIIDIFKSYGPGNNKMIQCTGLHGNICPADHQEINTFKTLIKVNGESIYNILHEKVKRKLYIGLMCINILKKEKCLLIPRVIVRMILDLSLKCSQKWETTNLSHIEKLKL